MKRILFIINSLKCGGAERLLVDILNNMDYDRYDASILTFNNRNVMISDTLPKQVKCIHAIGFGGSINHWRRKLYGKIGVLDTYYKKAVERAIGGNYDTIVSFLEGFPVRAHGYIRERAKRNITFVHTDLSAYPDATAQFESVQAMIRTYNQMDKIIFVSNGALDGFNKICGSTKADKYVLPNFIDIDAVRRKSEEFSPALNGNRFEIVLLGRVTEVKGYDIVPQIAKLLKDESIPAHFSIIGDGGYMGTLKKIIKDLNVADMISLLGFKANPYPFVKQAYIALSTSIAEGLPLSLCEAMALGVPIIASPTVGAEYLLSDGTGIIVSRNAEDFHAEIMRLYQNPDILKIYQTKSLNKSETFGKQVYMGKLYDLL